MDGEDNAIETENISPNFITSDCFTFYCVTLLFLSKACKLTDFPPFKIWNDLPANAPRGIPVGSYP